LRSNFVAVSDDEAEHGAQPVGNLGSTIFTTESPVGDYDIIIKGGTIVDGTRTPRYVSNLAIKGGKSPRSEA